MLKSQANIAGAARARIHGSKHCAGVRVVDSLPEPIPGVEYVRADVAFAIVQNAANCQCVSVASEPVVLPLWT